MKRMTGLIIPDAVSSWSRAGFYVQGNHVVFRNLTVRLEPTEAPGLVLWGWGDKIDVNELAGVPVVHMPDHPYSFVEHPNGLNIVDHVVLRANSTNLVKESFANIGYLPKRIVNDLYPGIRQMFYKETKESPIIEIVNVVDPDQPEPSQLSSHLWGFTLVTENMQKTRDFLKEDVGTLRNAKQPGRQICTLRHKNFGIQFHVAIMTPHVPMAKPTTSNL